MLAWYSVLSSVGVREILSSSGRPPNPELRGGDFQLGFFQCQLLPGGGLNVGVYAGGGTGLGDGDGDTGGEGSGVESKLLRVDRDSVMLASDAARSFSVPVEEIEESGHMYLPLPCRLWPRINDPHWWHWGRFLSLVISTEQVRESECAGR